MTRKSRRLTDRKSTRLNSSHTVIYTLSLHDALPILARRWLRVCKNVVIHPDELRSVSRRVFYDKEISPTDRSEEHTSELQSHRDLHSFPTRRSSDLGQAMAASLQECRHPPRRAALGKSASLL